MSSLIELIGTHPHLGVILEEWGIDYCFYSKHTLSQACEMEGIDEGEVAAALERAPRAPAPPAAFYHEWLRLQVSRVGTALKRARQLHSPSHLRLANLSEVFESLCGELSAASCRRRIRFRLTCLRVLSNHYRAPSTYDPSLDQLYLELRRLEKIWVQLDYLETRDWVGLWGVTEDLGVG